MIKLQNVRAGYGPPEAFMRYSRDRSDAVRGSYSRDRSDAVNLDAEVAAGYPHLEWAR
jgi:hypothetical protein